MKLLFDENLSSRLVQALEPEYPGSAHVRALGLGGATDAAIWERARQDAYAIVSKDNDFRQLSFLHGAPPKIIWLSRRLPFLFSRSLRVRPNQGLHGGWGARGRGGGLYVCPAPHRR